MAKSWEEWKKSRQTNTQNAARETAAASAPAATSWQAYRNQRLGITEPEPVKPVEQPAAPAARTTPEPTGTVARQRIFDARTRSISAPESKRAGQREASATAQNEKRRANLKTGLTLVSPDRVGPLRENERAAEADTAGFLTNFQDFLAEQKEAEKHFSVQTREPEQKETAKKPTQEELDALEGRANRLRGQMRPYDISGHASMSADEYERAQEAMAKEVKPQTKGKRVGAGQSAVQLPEEFEEPDYSYQMEGNIWDSFGDDFIEWQREDAAKRERAQLDQAFIDQIETMPEYDEYARQGSLSPWNRLGRISTSGSDSLEDRAFETYAPDDVKKKYLAILGSRGVVQAEKYISDMQEQWNAQMAQEEMRRIENAPAALRGIMEASTAIGSGLTQTFGGYGVALGHVLGIQGKQPVAVTSFVSQELKKKLDDESGWRLFGKEGWGWKKILYDTLETTAAQTPQIITGLGGGGSIATLGPMAVSVWGNTYNQAMHDGYTENEAVNLAAWSAAIEVATEKIGGVGFLSGGTWTEDMLSDWINHWDNAFARYAMNMGSNFLGEFTEEGVSGILDPYVDAFVRWESMSDEERANVHVDWDEVLYEAMLGGISGIAMGGPTTTAQFANEYQQQNEAYEMGKGGLTNEQFRESFAESNEDGAQDWAVQAYQKGMVEFFRRMGESGRSIESLEAEYGTLNDEQRAALEEGRKRGISEEKTHQMLEEMEVTVTTDQQTMEEAQAAQEAPAAESVPYDTGERLQTRDEEETTQEQPQEQETERQPYDNGERLQTREEPAPEIVQQAAEIAADRVADETVSQEEKVATVREALSAAGEVDNVQEKAEAIMNIAQGEEVTPEQMTMVAESDTATAFANRIAEAYQYGRAGLAVENLEAVTGEVTDEMRAEYERGREESRQETQQRAAALRENGENGAQPGRRGVTRNITQEEADRNGVRTIDRRHLSPKQRAARSALDVLGKATGINFVLYESSIGEGGEHIGRNGWYDNRTQSAYIDISSGRNGEQAMLRTSGHEITHFIENWSPEQYQNLRDWLVSYYNGKGADVLNGLVADEIESARELGREINETEAMSEVTANAMEMMLSDPEAIRQLARDNASLFVRIKLWLDSFLYRVQAAFRGVEADEEASKILMQDLESVREAQRLWYDALSDAGDALRGTIAAETRRQIDAMRPQAQALADVLEERIGQEQTRAMQTQSQQTALDNEEITLPGTQLTINDYMTERERAQAEAEKPKPKTRFPGLKERREREAAQAQEASEMTTEETAPAAEPARKTSKAFKNLLNKWAANEWVNQPMDGSDAAQRFTDFAERWYNGGRDGLRSIDVARENPTQDAEYPVFLQDFFYAQGKKEAVTEQKRKATKTKKGAAANGEEAQVHNDGTVSQPGQDGQGTVRLLDAVSPEVQQDTGRSGDVLGEPAERGGTSGHGVRELAGSGVSGVGSRGGAQTNDDGNAAGAGDVSDDTLTPAEAVEKKAAETEAPAKNFHFDKLDLPRGEKARFNANLEAIRTVKQIIAEDRTATPAEQEILSKYVGWGGLANAFDDTKSEWKKEYKQLKAALTPEEYNAAKQSTINAHYTETSVIQAMYNVLRSWGFKGGKMLEPSAGVGNFLGAMPTDMAQLVTSWRAVELDSLTGQILKALYPQACVEIMGFQDSRIPDDSIDVAIGNVPFGQTKPYDKRYIDTPVNNLHNYFFAKAVDKVRPGGLVFFITSAFTMDANNNKDDLPRKFRRYMDERADFKGAVRLPNDAFKGNANTSVVTDILVFQKRAPGARNLSEKFVDTSYSYLYKDGRYAGSVRVNEYFKDHPDMVLGTLSNEGTMYGGENEMTVIGNGQALAPQIEEALGKLDVHMKYERTVNPTVAAEAAARAGKRTKNNGYEIKDGKVYQSIDGELQEVQMDAAERGRLKGLLDLRDAGRDVIEAQKLGKTDAEISEAQKTLNKLYDAFVKKYGYIHTKQNQKAMGADPDRQFISALENYDEDNKTGSKADIFSRRVYQRVSRPKSAGTISEAILITQNETGGKLDLDRVAKLLGVSKAEARTQMLDSRQAFLDEDGNLVARDEYLSGYVRTKLKTAQELAENDERYKANVEELEKVVPRDKTADEITVHMGESWIPAEIYETYINLRLGLWGYRDKKLTVVRDLTGHWMLSETSSKLRPDARRRDKANGAAGTALTTIFEATMNGKQLVIKEPGTKGKVIDREATALVQKAQEELRKDFKGWLFKGGKQAKNLLKLYNDTYRNYVAREYDGSAFTVNGLDPKVQLRDYQTRAAQRVIQQGGNVLLAHCVGAGKTATMAATAMKMRELGLVKKPMFVVPKAVCAQWGTEFLKFFPSAKVLTASAEDFTKDNRREFVNRIATNDYDAVVLSYEQFSRIEMSKEKQAEFINRQLDEARMAMEEAKRVQGKDGRSVKQIAKSIASLEAKLKKITDSVKDVDNIDFEDLGVDGLFVDEAHNFKNLYYSSGMSVSGLGSPEGSQRAADLYMKTQYLQELNGGRGIVFATATPVMNSMVEMFTMQRYLQPETLKRYGVNTFDGWASMFGQVVTNITASPSGEFRAEKTFGSFNNLAELERMFRANADVMTQLPTTVKLPKLRGGKHIVVECDATPFQKEYIKHLGDRAQALSGNKSGQLAPDPNRHPELLANIEDRENDNMLVICSDGRKVAMSQRLVDPSLPWGDESKIYKCADNVWQEYQDDNDNKGTQLIFCDLSVPKGGSETASEEQETDKKKKKTKAEKEAEARGAENLAAEAAAANDVYNEIRRALIERGIPAKEIAFIHDFDTDQKKDVLRKAMESGTIRVLIGSTVKMGVGLNVQKRICAMHHLDCPWRPGDLEQRNGRGIRNGNMHDEVAIYEYVTVGTFDTRMWGKIRDKNHFINQALNGNEEMDDIPGDDMGMSAAETMAAASGNPLILEQIKNQQDIERLEALKAGIERETMAKRQQAQYDRLRAEALERDLPLVQADARLAESAKVTGDDFTIEIGEKTFTDRKEAGAALIKAVQQKYVAKANGLPGESTYERRGSERLFKIGTYAGFDLIADTNLRMGIEGKLVWAAKINENSQEGTMRSLLNLLKRTSSEAEAIPEQVKALNERAATQEKAAEMAFDQQKELDRLKTRNYEIEQILNPQGQTNFVDAEADDSDIQPSERKPGLKSDRQLLAEAMETVAANEQERGALQRYKANVERIDGLNDQLNDVNEEIRKLSFSAGQRNTKRLTELKTRQRVLENTITREDRALIRLERSELLRNILNVEKKRAVQKARKAADERLERYKERYAPNDGTLDLKKSIRQKADELRKWLLEPTQKQYIPKLAQDSIANLLSAIDFSSVRKLRTGEPTRADMRLAKAMEALDDMLEQTRPMSGMTEEDAVNMVFGQYADLPPDFLDSMRALTREIRQATDRAIDRGGFTINEMNNLQLRELKKLLNNMFHILRTMNKTMQAGLYDNVQQMGEDSLMDFAEMGEQKEQSKLTRAIVWNHTTPVFAFKRFGRAGKAIWEGIKKGDRTFAQHIAEMDEFNKKSGATAAEVEAWRSQLIDVELTDNSTLTIPATFAMSMYALSKRPQAMGHILGQGIRAEDYASKLGKKVAGKEKQDYGHTMTRGDVQKIIDQLSDRQKNVVDTYQKFMGETGGQWGNYVSRRRFGTDQYTEGATYWPIKTDPEVRTGDPTTPDNGKESLYRLLNMGFTKTLVKGANNRILLGDFFDTYSDHMAEMAQYNAYALIVLDMVKWINYTSKYQNPLDKTIKISAVKTFMRRALGQGAMPYLTQFVKDLSGAGATGTSEMTNSKLLRMRNRGAVAANLRVIALQPMAMFRGLMHLSPRDIATGFMHDMTPAKIKANIQEMQTYSGTGIMKKYGFYDANASRSVRELIAPSGTRVQQHVNKALDFMMKGAETADTLTWGMLWEATKQRMERTNKDLTPGTEEFKRAVGEAFDDLVYQTQVVDMVTTRSQYMRSGETMHKLMSSFMMEPVLTYNQLLDAFMTWKDDARKVGKELAWRNNAGRIGRTVAVYAITAAITAMAESIVDAMRDDDDYETFVEKLRQAYLGNLIDDISPVNKIPILSQLWDGGKMIAAVFDVDTYGFGTGNPLGDAIETGVKTAEVLKKYLSGKSGYTGFGLAQQLAKLPQNLFGVPIATIMKDGAALWNTAGLPFAPGTRIETYRTSDSVAGEQFVRAYKYEDTKRMRELTEMMGYNHVDVAKTVTAAARDAFKKGKLSENDAVDLLMEYGGHKTRNDAALQVHKWETQVETGNSSAGDYGRIYGYIDDWNGPALKEEIKTLLSLGKEKKTIASSITSRYKASYLAASTTEKATMKQHLIEVYKMLGYSQADAKKKIEAWN